MKAVSRPEDAYCSGAETDTSGGRDIVSFFKPLRRRRNGDEPTYQMSIRPRVSVVVRFNKLAEEGRLSNPELLELLLDTYEREKSVARTI
jgi:hypothetical protein